ncbi:hypothetical protein [Cohaesibacter sp. ES.047]|uniref:hypothetical protein n=1 Tax=Cohaesibacter sp. ES.047 TaxID=1798205 RepID=UPI0012FD39D8|nr:hypothetical protein [Cohaesibacter sp. ES.047]
MTAQTRASLLALQEEETAEPPVQSVTVNGLKIIVSGHSVDAREGISLLRTASPSDSQSMIAAMAEMKDPAENGGDAQSQTKASSGDPMFKAGEPYRMVEIASEALGPRPDGATSAYMNEDFSYNRGRWSNGNPIGKSNSEDAIAEDNRVRLEALMKSVDAERKLRAEYGQDVKLVYSHTDNSYIMLTPDDAKYDTMKSAESAVQGVIDEVERGFVDRGMAADILGRYGYQI